MKKRTYRNMLNATRLIVDTKGYEWDEANDIAIQCFDQMELLKNGMPVEWFISKVVEKENRGNDFAERG